MNAPSRPHYTPLFSSIRHSTKLAALPDDTCRLFYVLLLAQCDAWGRVDGRPAVLFAEVWPLLGKSAAETERCRNETARVGLIEICELEGVVWIRLPDWEEKAGLIGKRDHRRASRWPDTGPRWPGLAQAGPSSSTPARGGPRARAHSQPQPQPQPYPQPEPERENAGARAREAEPVDHEPDHPPSGPPALTRGDSSAKAAKKAQGTPATEHWQAEWNRTRPTPWAWKRQDAIQLAQCVKMADGDFAEVCRRITRLLESPDAFHLKAASPGLLLSQWNNLGFELQRISKSDSAIAELARQASRPPRSMFDLDTTGETQ